MVHLFRNEFERQNQFSHTISSAAAEKSKNLFQVWTYSPIAKIIIRVLKCSFHLLSLNERFFFFLLHCRSYFIHLWIQFKCVCIFAELNVHFCVHKTNELYNKFQIGFMCRSNQANRSFQHETVITLRPRCQLIFP